MYTKRNRKDNSVCINNAFLLVQLGVMLEINLFILVDHACSLQLYRQRLFTPCRMEKTHTKQSLHVLVYGHL